MVQDDTVSSTSVRCRSLPSMASALAMRDVAPGHRSDDQSSGGQVDCRARAWPGHRLARRGDQREQRSRGRAVSSSGVSGSLRRKTLSSASTSPRPARARRLSLSLQLPAAQCHRQGNLGNVPALKPGSAQLVDARPAVAAIAVFGQRRGAVGRAAGDLVHPQLALEAVGQADDHHAEMQQHDVGRQDRRLLAAMLAAGRGKDATDLADQLVLAPEPPGPIQEILHLCGHVAEAGRRADDDRVVVGELGNGRDRRRLVELVARLCATSSGTSSGTRFTTTSAPACLTPSATA